VFVTCKIKEIKILNRMEKMENKIKLINKILLAVLIVGISTAYSQDGNSDNHTVSIEIPQIALLDTESNTTKDISITMEAPTEAGETMADQTDDNIWLNVTSIVASGGTRDISVKIDIPITGLDLKVKSEAYAGNGFGSWGVTQGELTISTTDQTLVSGIGSGYTVDGANNGYNLTYTASPKANADFGSMVSTIGTDIIVTYTLTP